jgi:hypothetical protein
MRRIWLLALLTGCGSATPVLAGTPVSKPDLMSAVTINYWLRVDEDRHRTLCVLADAADAINEAVTIDINTAGMFSTSALIELCKDVPPARAPRNS